MQSKQWFVFTFFVIGCAVFAYQYFDQAIPFVKVAITMDYDQACSKAQEIVDQNDWSFKDFQVVAKYTDSPKLQAFVELEGGGKQAFIDMIEKDYFQPYAWHVRFFKEKEVSELIIAFTPQGKPYEFAMKLPETLQGKALSKEQAHDLALQKAALWDVDLKPYDLVESNKEELPSGRIDYTFMYQRQDVSLEKAHYRIKLKVAGDVLSEMQRMVKIPNEFNRRYEQMFSLNTMIASFARNVGFMLYFFIFGLFIFVFFFHRKNGFLIKPVLKFLSFLATLFVVSVINEWDLIWNHYPTHMPMFGFVVQKVAEILGSILFLLLLIGCTMLLAEAAGRLAFKKQIQFFTLCSLSVLGSYQGLTQVVVGYGCAVIMLGYAVAFSLCSQTLGWWIPLSNLMDPNILATKIPSFSPIVNAFRAGFMEEFLCRALPLAGIALMAQNSKHKKWWIAVIFVVQIVIFGALHANYPQQPAYYRIVELIFHSTCFGLLYLYFGLLPGIIAHFVFDAMLMSIPIFVSTLLWQKVLTVIMIGLPLFFVLVAWILQKFTLKNVTIGCLNESLNVEQDDSKDVTVRRRTSDPISLRVRLAGYAFGLIGLLLWSQSCDFDIQTSKITISLADVEKKARNSIEDISQSSLSDTWKVSYQYLSPIDSLGGKFIWQTFGKNAYQALQGSYILSPAYMIKFTKFEGPVEERSEFFEVVIQADGSLSWFHHALPEFWAGADLTEAQAHDHAYEWISKIYHIEQVDLQIVSSQSVKHHDRRDWSIVIKDLKNYGYDQGQARIQVDLCGNELSKIIRFVHPVEQWQREEQSRMTQQQLLKILLAIFFILCCAIFAGMAIARFGVKSAYFVLFISLTLSFVVFYGITLGNNWSEILSNFNTSEPLSYQLCNLIGNSFIKMLVKAAALTLFILSSVYFAVRVQPKKIGSGLLLGTALGLGIFGCSAFLQNFEPSLVPNSSYNGFSIKMIPIFDIFSDVILQMISSAIIMMAVCAVSQYFSHRSWLHFLIFMIAGISLSSSAQLIDVPVWIFSGICLGLLWYVMYKYFLSHDGDLMWIIMMTGQIMQLVPSMLHAAYPDIFYQVTVASVLAIGFVSWMYAKI